MNESYIHQNPMINGMNQNFMRYIQPGIERDIELTLEKIIKNYSSKSFNISS